MHQLDMLIQSVDVIYESFLSDNYYYNLSCSLLNVYKGRCNLIVANNETKIKQELTIKHDRAIMEGNIIVGKTFFKSLSKHFSIKSDRPAKILLSIDKKLNINQDGILFVDREIKTSILNFQFFLPIY